MIKRALIPLIKNDKSWKLLRRFAVAGLFLNNYREKFERERHPMRRELNELKDFDFLFPEKQVLHGPFEGMVYPSFSSVCSMLYPKLIGSYEKELQSYVLSFCNNQYSEILDIGCAEGYYAIGLALRNPDSNIYAYDTDDKARSLCYEMAKANGVDGRVEIRTSCNADDLAAFKFRKKGLVISDCEGYELHLFTSKNIANLKNCDVLIETHDFIDINITTYLCDLFQFTHDITVIKSTDDIEKAKSYKFPEAEKFSLNEKKLLYGEGRPGVMEWLVCIPKVAE